jgi:hypothetical protein
MSAEARRQPDPFEQLRNALEGEWNHDALAEYVGELDKYRHEEEIFRRRALRSGNVAAAGSNADSAGGGISGGGAPELYEAMSAENRAKLRQWWHEKARQEAYRHEDLRTRLSWRYMV